MKLKKFLIPFVPSILFRIRETLSPKPLAKRTCNICGFEGYFDIFGRPARLDAQCPKCKSLERHRLLMLAWENGRISFDIDPKVDEVLHFAAEAILEKIFREKYKNYKTADLFNDADLKIDLENIDLPDNKYKLVIASHVLEHVDDKKAASELSRIITNDGIVIAMVPIVEGWDKTYENPQITSEKDRDIHFGQGDHVRYYGRDFRDRMQIDGLKLICGITAEGKDVIDFGLLRGEKVFVFAKFID
jgi:SAM-dependent methyltransferase